MGASLNGGTQKKQNDHFSRKTHGCWVPPFLETPTSPNLEKRKTHLQNALFKGIG